jgi:tetratricopeptide (TPR) repeat protein
MMKRIMLFGLALLCTAASATQNPDPKRVHAIWEAVNERISRQSDVWFKDGDYPRAVQLLRFHYSLDPSDYEVGTNLGWMLENIEQWDQALAVYIQLRTSNPKNLDDAWPEANYYYMKKAYAKVPPILEPTIKGHDPQPNIYRTLAHAYEKMNMFSDCKRVWQLYISKHPEDGTAKANLDRVTKKLSGGNSGK